MSSSLDVFDEALQQASNPVNPPPAKRSALDVSSPASLLDPSLVGQWRSNTQFTPPNTAIDSNDTQWNPPGPQYDESPISGLQQVWPEGCLVKREPSKSYLEAEADFDQQAMAFDGVSQICNRNEYPCPPGIRNNMPGEPPQSKTSAVDDLFSDIDESKLPDFDAMDQDGNVFEMSGLGQQPQEPIPPIPSASLQTIPDIYQTPYHATIISKHEFADPASHPSPTESQLVAEGFEFHNELPEEVQINRFNDKAFRKALREVQSDLPRKQQWYAWSKAKQMLNCEPESATTAEQMENNWGEPLKRQDQIRHEHAFKHEHEPKYQIEYQPEYQAECESYCSRETVLPTFKATCTQTSQPEDVEWDPAAQSTSLGTTVHESPGQEHHEVDHRYITQSSQTKTSGAPASTGAFAAFQGDSQASHEAHNHGDWASKPVQIDQDRLLKHPLGKVISKLANEHKATQQGEDKGAAQSTTSQFTAASREEANTSDIATVMETAKKLAEIGFLREELHQADREVLSKMKEALEGKMFARREGSAHGLLSHSITNPAASDMPYQSTHDTEHGIHAATPEPSATAPPLPPRPSTSNLNSSTSIHSADLCRPHTNTILRRSPFSSPSRHLPPPFPPNRHSRSPSPWIDHPGINRPDTPRPIPPTRTSDNTGVSIRQSVERSRPFSDRIRSRENTPAYTQRSLSLSPRQHPTSGSLPPHNIISLLPSPSLA